MKMKRFIRPLFLASGMLLLLSLSSKATNNPDGFVTMDKNIRQMISFYDSDTIILVIPDHYRISENDMNEIRNFVFWKQKPEYIVKCESELNDSDLRFNLHFFGPCCRFSGAHFSGTPFAVSEKGFTFGGTGFTQPEDAFYFMNSSGNRLYTCRNGENTPLSYTRYMAGAYQLYIFSGERIVVPALPQETEHRIASMVWFHTGRIASQNPKNQTD
ncbi:hypothetical protein TBC1_11160 [Lentimicrobium saccharophilum]|uniref:Uncharacterized protein n=2 Tax=Lentimicrobium saccharophilum TaxID=1678841 RepID=A0A0S7BZ20_9BACT|nr:hypothetical protein TBC1_11160 [Lentimicrobium saccharophilum]